MDSSHCRSKTRIDKPYSSKCFYEQFHKVEKILTLEILVFYLDMTIINSSTEARPELAHVLQILEINVFSGLYF